jgi:DNA-binding NarL/FixJ family response regulator
MDVVAEAGNAAEALQKVFEHRPEVVITDNHIFDCTPAHSEQMILQVSPQSKVLFLSMHASENPLPARRDGASCAVRQTSVEELVEMVRRASCAERAVQEPTAKRDSKEWPEEHLAGKRALTAREREVLKLLAEGRTVRSTAVVLGLSAKTVDAHKFNLMRKLGIHNKAELVMWAIQKKVVKLPASS